jgi:hypothetical protein
MKEQQKQLLQLHCLWAENARLSRRSEVLLYDAYHGMKN